MDGWMDGCWIKNSVGIWAASKETFIADQGSPRPFNNHSDSFMLMKLLAGQKFKHPSYRGASSDFHPWNKPWPGGQK